jgi:NTE family protein
MVQSRTQKPSRGRATAKPAAKASLPGRVVLVMQGGGALGAYPVGVYQALSEAGIEPDWVIGTSIGAINAALIAGNPPARRLERLNAFWSGVEQNAAAHAVGFPGLGSLFANLTTMAQGIPTFFTPNPKAWLGPNAAVGLDDAAYYTTEPLRKTLAGLVDFAYLEACHTRMTVGAVNVDTGELRYFDSRDEKIAAEHVMASAALPPSFPAIRVDGEPYWDGSIYSNTPIEAVLDDNPRSDSIIFTTHMWNPGGPEPESLWQVMGRQKEIQFASRSDSHIARQKQIHHLRHVIMELAKQLPAKSRASPKVRELMSWGCHTTMHIVQLVAPRLEGEDQLKDIDFTPFGIRTRREAGYLDTQRILARAPWHGKAGRMEGVIIHEARSRLGRAYG